jgi:Ca-activated chloride channel family protein
MTFAQPDYLYALALMPIMALFVVWAGRRRLSALASLGDPSLIDRLSRSVDWRGRRVRSWLWFVALALLIVALARPRWGSAVQVVERQGVQIIVALDVSTSMLAEDIKPNRLKRAKLEIVDLMSRLDGDEVGLVLFSGASFLQFPLTFDYSTARRFLDEAGPQMISRPGTAIGKAIETAVNGFDERRASQKVILIITDGESHEGDPLAAARQAREEGVVIYTIGFGSPEGEPIPEYDAFGRMAGFKQDQRGEVVLSKLDEVTLQQIAREGGGKYYRATADGRVIENLADDFDALQKESFESELKTRHIERFQVFLAAALLVLVAMELIPERVTTWLGRHDRTAEAA